MENVKEIVKMILDTPTIDRGSLFLEISDGLRSETQGYTSMLFKKIAEEYGYKGQNNGN